MIWYQSQTRRTTRQKTIKFIGAEQALRSLKRLWDFRSAKEGRGACDFKTHCNSWQQDKGASAARKHLKTAVKARLRRRRQGPCAKSQQHSSCSKSERQGSLDEAADRRRLRLNPASYLDAGAHNLNSQSAVKIEISMGVAKFPTSNSAGKGTVMR